MFDLSHRPNPDVSARASRRTPSPLGLVAGLVLALAVVGCGGDSTGPGGGPNPGPSFGSAIIFRGSVTDTDGREVFGTVVRATVEVWDEGCTDEVVEPLGDSEVTVNEAGEYSLTLTFEREEWDACVLLEAVPPAGSPLQPGVDLSQDVDVNEPTDVVHVFQKDFVLEP